MNDSRWLFEPPSPEQLASRADDLIHRATLVRNDGWADYRQLWSYGEILGVALVLDDKQELDQCGESVLSALERWAYDLWGITEGQADADLGSLRTRAWFDCLRSELGTLFSHQPPTTR